MAPQTPRGTAITSATIETISEPTNNGMMPYQSCQKLAVIHCVPNRKEVIARYAGTGLFGSHARSFSTTAGSCFAYCSTSAFHFVKAFRDLALVNAGDTASSSFIWGFIESAICANLSVAERSAANCSAALPAGAAAALD